MPVNGTVGAVRVLVVSNPRATTTTARQRDVLVHALAADAKLEVEETANRGHAAALACRAMRDGVDVVVALGGDGTVNEVVNGLLTDGVHAGVPALGMVPGWLHQRLRPRARPAQRPGRGDLGADRRDGRPAAAAGSGWAWPTTAGSCSPPASATTRRWSPRWRRTAGVARPRPTRSTSAPRSAPSSPSDRRHPPDRACELPDGEHRRRPVHGAGQQLRPVDVPRQHAGLAHPAWPPSTPGWTSTRRTRMGAAGILLVGRPDARTPTRPDRSPPSPTSQLRPSPPAAGGATGSAIDGLGPVTASAASRWADRARPDRRCHPRPAEPTAVPGRRRCTRCSECLIRFRRVFRLHSRYSV